MSIVTPALAKAHMNIDGTADDELISLYIGAAETFIGNYIGRPLADLDPLPDDLKLAVLKLVAFYYEQREAVVTVNATGGDPASNADLAKQVSAQIEASMRGVIVDEISRQARPGNTLNRRGR